MLPRHRIAATVKVSSATALDTVIPYVAPAVNDGDAERRGVFFILLHADEIDALLPWVNTYIHYLNESYDAYFKENADATVEKAVAVTAQKARHKLQQLISEARSLSLSDISFCLGAINGYDVHLTSEGNISAFLLHTLKSQYDDEPKYRWIKITDDDDTENDDESAVSILSGRMQPNDTLFICTESVLDGLGLNQIEKVISRASVDGAKLQLEKTIANVGGRVGFAAIILRSTVEQVETKLPPYRSNDKAKTQADSMHHLHESEKTANLLLDPKRHPSPFNNLMSKFKTEAKENKQPKKISQTNPNQTKKFKNPFSVISKNSSINSRQQLSAVASHESNKLIEKITAFLRGLPMSSRRLLLISILFAYLFTQSLVFLANRQTADAEAVKQQQTVEQIQDYLDQAESSLIFNDDTNTAKLLSDAETLIAGLSRDTRTQEERYRILSEQASSLRDRLERVYESDTKTIVTFSEQFAADMIVFVNNSLITATTNGSFNQVSLSGEISPVNIEGLNTVAAKFLDVSDNGEIYASTENSEVLINPANQSLLVKPVTDSKSVIAVAHYQDRMYALSPADQQIYRYAGGPEFSNPSPWVNGNANILSDGVDLIVDGSVYVLTKQGTVHKYVRGVIQNWSASATYGDTEGMTKLVSPNGSDYLFALDRERNRIVMWEKLTGKLVNQFSYPSIGPIIDFAIRDDNQVIYLLTNSEIASAAIVK